MINRTSPKKPLIAAFATACIAMLFAAGYRGKYHSTESPLSFEESGRVFVFVLAAAFIVFYALRMLGVHMGPMGGKEDESKSVARKSDVR